MVPFVVFPNWHQVPLHPFPYPHLPPQPQATATPPPAAFPARQEGCLVPRVASSFAVGLLASSKPVPSPCLPPEPLSSDRDGVRWGLHPPVGSFTCQACLSAPPGPPNTRKRHRKGLNGTCPLTLGTCPSATSSTPPLLRPNKNGKQETLVF